MVTGKRADKVTMDLSRRRTKSLARELRSLQPEKPWECRNAQRNQEPLVTSVLAPSSDALCS